jgi:hypothetical protein
MYQQSARGARTAEQNLCELAARVIDVPLNEALREIQGVAGGEAGDSNVPAHLRIHDLSADRARACGCATAKASSRFICSAVPTHGRGRMVDVDIRDVIRESALAGCAVDNGLRLARL